MLTLHRGAARFCLCVQDLTAPSRWLNGHSLDPLALFRTHPAETCDQSFTQPATTKALARKDICGGCFIASARPL